MQIDRIEPDRDFVQRVSVHVDASPREAMQALREVTPDDMPIATWLGELRYLPGRVAGRAEEPSDGSRPFIDEILEGGSVVLAERDDDLVIGGIGKYHQIRDQQPVRIPDAGFYERVADASYPKLAIEVCAVERDEGCDLVLEAHTHPLGAATRKKFARYWLVIGPMGRFVSWLLLRAAKRRAEGRGAGAAHVLEA